MAAFLSILFGPLLICGILCLYLYARPTRILLTGDSLIIHSAYKDYAYPREGLIYKGEVPREIWSNGLYRTFGIGSPLPLAGKFRNPAFGDVVIVSMTRPEVLQRVDAEGKILLLQLSVDQVRDLNAPAVEGNRW